MKLNDLLTMPYCVRALDSPGVIAVYTFNLNVHLPSNLISALFDLEEIRRRTSMAEPKKLSFSVFFIIKQNDF